MLKLSKWWRSLELIDRLSIVIAGVSILWLACVTLPTIWANAHR